MTTATAWPVIPPPDFDIDPHGYPVQLETGGIRCASCQGRHQTVDAVHECHRIAENERGQADAEIYAENAAVRYAEMGDPASWHDEQIERLTEIYGYGPPPGYYPI